METNVQTMFLLSLLVCLVALLSTTARAQNLDFSISPAPVGSGARAAGMADAFVAVADDATAASWNPAGLVQLEKPELSIVGDWNGIVDSFSAAAPHRNEADHNNAAVNLNFASLTYPLPFLIGSRNSVISVTYQHRFDFTGDYKVSIGANSYFTPPFPGGIPTLIQNRLNYRFDQKGSLGTISPAYAIEITNNLSIGIALNYWRSSFLSDSGWEQTTTIDAVSIIGDGDPTFTHQVTTEKYEDFKGENFTAGLLWNVTPKWNLALRYDSAFEGKLTFNSTRFQTVTGQPNTTTVLPEEPNKMNLPETWTIGAAYRHSDRLTLAVQISRTDWNDFYIKDEEGVKVSLIDSTTIGDPETDTDFDPTLSIRFGIEYLLLPKRPDSELKYLWSLRGGVMYDEEPASGRSSFDPNSVGTGKADRFYGFALGAGLQVARRINFDIAYQLRYGDDVKSDRVRGLDGFSEDYLQHRVILSSIIYF